MVENLLKQRFYADDRKNPLYLHHSADFIYRQILKELKSEGKSVHGLSLDVVRKFLQQQRGYTLYKNSTKSKTERNPYRVWGLDQLWELDLVTFPKLTKFNSGYVYLLVCIDVFSRFAFVRPLFTKQPREIVKALVDIFENTLRIPRTIQSDAGKEFVGKNMQDFLKSYNIKFRIPKTSLPAKCAVVEAFNRTLKQRIARYLNWKRMNDKTNPNRYIDALQMIVDDYNGTKHSRLRWKPNEVTKENATRVYHQNKMRLEHKFKSYNDLKPKIKAGDLVRYRLKRKIFDKLSMTPTWSEDIYVVKRVLLREPFPMFELETLEQDAHGRRQLVDGKFYEREIQKIGLPLDQSTPISVNSRPSIFNKEKIYNFKTLSGADVNINENDLDGNDATNVYDIMRNLIKKKSLK